MASADPRASTEQRSTEQRSTGQRSTEQPSTEQRSTGQSSAGPRTCSIARTLDIVGEKWALLALREVFLGNRRFDEMVRRTGAPRDTLTARLKTMTAAGILERRPYSEHPARFEYFLTDAGRDLYPVIATLMWWGDKHLAGDDGPPLVLEHTCGHRLVAQLTCQACGEPLESGQARIVRSAS